jgi:hypothetical protein
VSTVADDDLWSEFHGVVNMPVPVLADWLRIAPSDPDWAHRPDPVSLWTGYRVLNILRKRQPELDEEDLAVMRQVVDEVRSADVGVKDHAMWHRRLLSMGHDPAKKAA